MNKVTNNMNGNQTSDQTQTPGKHFSIMPAIRGIVNSGDPDDCPLAIKMSVPLARLLLALLNEMPKEYGMDTVLYIDILEQLLKADEEGKQKK